MKKTIYKKNQIRYLNQGGYTLIELMAAVGVFAIVMSVSSGLFITSIKGQKKAFSNQMV